MKISTSFLRYGRQGTTTGENYHLLKERLIFNGSLTCEAGESVKPGASGPRLHDRDLRAHECRRKLKTLESCRSVRRVSTDLTSAQHTLRQTLKDLFECVCEPVASFLGTFAGHINSLSRLLLDISSGISDLINTLFCCLY